jgi:hypothetical protein
MTDTRALTTCDGCGQTDDHPMLHVGPYVWQKDDRTTVTDPSFHFDCVPDALVAEFGLTEDAPQHAVTVAAMAKAKDGVHGDKLLAFIEKQPSDNDVTPEG